MHAGFLEVPDWFSTENEGCGIAVADLGGDGTQDLIAFMIDHPAARTGAFTGSAGHWTPTATSPAAGRLGRCPNWFSADNQGGGIAVSDLNGDGTQDLVVS